MADQDIKGWQEALRRIEEAKLSNASELDLSRLSLKNVPNSITGLTNLSTLILSRNRLTHFQDSLVLPPQLQRLVLTRNHLSTIDAPIMRLGLLQVLELDENEILTIPDSISELSNLVSINIQDNFITDIPDSFAHLINLQLCNLSYNQICNIPPSFANLAALEELNLSSNKISSFPEVLYHLRHLRVLNLSFNDIAILPDSLAEFSDLYELSLRHNRLTAIPHSLSQLKRLAILKLAGNPLPEELLSSLKGGVRVFFRYLQSLSVDKVYPRTVKLVLLGEPGSGKTTLLEAFKGNPCPCSDSRPETLGVDVRTIERLHPTDQQAMYLSIWDFAGQHIEHATHQFFLTEHAIYLVLWNARQGTETGKRDLWYWLEILKMRVRQPKFLLVATHTEYTPPDLNLFEIEHSYGGFQGHFPVELSTLRGFSALEKKVLELAAESPSLQAEWPSSWLVVRDELRDLRRERPYMSPDVFFGMMNNNRVTSEEMQKDLARQLHNLGEIIYFQEREELSTLVILDPEWLSELIALVVRSQDVRIHKGILYRENLEELWSSARISIEVRNHLIRLMDWFDVTYSTGDATQLGIVVEALPFSTPDDIKRIHPDGGRPQMEMIFRFPSLQRHLPPGIPTWGIARAHRFSRCTPWRDAAAFEDTDTNSQALILASDITKEIRLRVAADYPPFFFGRLEAILRDTFKRYPGSQPQRRLPCRCRGGCLHSYNYETVLKRWLDGAQFVVCDESGENIEVASLLTGARPNTSAGVRALQSEMRRIATEQLRAQRERMEKTCPSVFTLVPSRSFTQLDTWLESVTLGERVELVLYCEHDSGWHPTTHSLYSFRLEREWFGLVKKHWTVFVKATKFVGPLAKTVGKASGAVWGEIGASAIDRLPELSHAPIGSLSEELGIREHPEFIDPEARFLLEQLINHFDAERGETEPKNGGLHPYLIDDGRLLWLCPDHLRLYRERQ